VAAGHRGGRRARRTAAPLADPSFPQTSRTEAGIPGVRTASEQDVAHLTIMSVRAVRAPGARRARRSARSRQSRGAIRSTSSSTSASTASWTRCSILSSLSTPTRPRCAGSCAIRTRPVRRWFRRRRPPVVPPATPGFGLHLRHGCAERGDLTLPEAVKRVTSDVAAAYASRIAAATCPARGPTRYLFDSGHRRARRADAACTTCRRGRAARHAGRRRARRVGERRAQPSTSADHRGLRPPARAARLSGLIGKARDRGRAASSRAREFEGAPGPPGRTSGRGGVGPSRGPH